MEASTLTSIDSTWRRACKQQWRIAGVSTATVAPLVRDWLCARYRHWQIRAKEHNIAISMCSTNEGKHHYKQNDCTCQHLHREQKVDD